MMESAHAAHAGTGAVVYVLYLISVAASYKAYLLVSINYLPRTTSRRLLPVEEVR
jgi:hypothetical protein